MDQVLQGGVAPDVLSFHYGDPGSVQPMLHKCMAVLTRVLQEPVEERNMKWFEIFHTCLVWGVSLSLLTRDPSDMAVVAAAMSKANMTWSEVESTVHTHQSHSPYIYVDEAHPGIVTAEMLILLNKLIWVLLATEPGVTAAEILASLPDFDEVHKISMSTAQTGVHGAMGCTPTAGFLLAMVCEKYGRFEEAVPWAAAAASDDCGQLGTKNVYMHSQARRVHGRCLAKLGKATEAVEAFESAAKIGAESGLFLEELLALSELHSFVGGQYAQGTMGRMKLVVTKMLGLSPKMKLAVTTERLESLAKAKLAAGVTLGAIMAA